MRVTLLLIPLLAGCANTTGVARLGPDTYTISAAASMARGAEGGARNMAITEANAYCATLGREIMVTNISSGPRGPAGTADITFQCLAAGDRDLTRPDYRKEPNVVIEDRRK